MSSGLLDGAGIPEPSAKWDFRRSENRNLKRFSLGLQKISAGLSQ